MTKAASPEFHVAPAVATADGSSTCWNERIGEHYHSLHGAQTESEHVFIQAGLAAVSERIDGPIRVLELGFGTGLNALLAEYWAEKHARSLDYLGFEPYPLDQQSVQNLRFPGLKKNYLDKLTWLHAGLAIPLSQSSSYRIVQDSQVLRRFAVLPMALEKWDDKGERFNVVFHDAFSPDRDPEPWSEAMMERLFHLLQPGGALVTYCAKGIIRRRLQATGFAVERLPGPPGKREMLRAWRSQA